MKTRQIVEQIINHLNANLPSKLAQANLALPTGIEYGDLVITSPTVLPRLSVDINRYPQQQATLGVQGKLRQKMEGEVWVAVAGSDKEETAKLLHDYTDCVAEVLATNVQAGGLALILQVTEVDFSPTVRFQNALLRVSRIRFTVVTEHRRL
ncbi:MAG: hypothetical protein RMK89_10925 [Armatimonadota bacterium]|nr:hypothetical protein [Armatimonadota bacterium]MDW8143962.1 hypothetical protein [Armatimonadota bacterium]